MPKTYYCALKPSRRTCKQALFVPLLVYIFVKRNVNKKGHDRCTFSSIITIIREVQAQGFVIGQQTAPLKHERSQGHTSAIHHQNCLSQRQLYILLKLPSHSLHSYCSQLYCYMKVALLNKKSKQLAVQISSLSGRGFKYIILKCLATV